MAKETSEKKKKKSNMDYSAPVAEALAKAASQENEAAGLHDRIAPLLRIHHVLGPSLQRRTLKGLSESMLHICCRLFKVPDRWWR